MLNKDIDDKDLVIFSVLIISIIAMLVDRNNAVAVAQNAFTGLFGVAVGKSMGNNNGTK